MLTLILWYIKLYWYYSDILYTGIVDIVAEFRGLIGAKLKEKYELSALTNIVTFMAGPGGPKELRTTGNGPKASDYQALSTLN